MTHILGVLLVAVTSPQVLRELTRGKVVNMDVQRNGKGLMNIAMIRTEATICSAVTTCDDGPVVCPFLRSSMVLEAFAQPHERQG